MSQSNSLRSLPPHVTNFSMNSISKSSTLTAVTYFYFMYSNFANVSGSAVSVIFPPHRAAALQTISKYYFNSAFSKISSISQDEKLAVKPSRALVSTAHIILSTAIELPACTRYGPSHFAFALLLSFHHNLPSIVFFCIVAPFHSFSLSPVPYSSSVFVFSVIML